MSSAGSSGARTWEAAAMTFQARPPDPVLRAGSASCAPARIDWATYVGGTADDALSFVSRDETEDCALLSGVTASTDFPGHRAIQPSPGGGGDAFIARICETDVLGRVDPQDALTQVL